MFLSGTSQTGGFTRRYLARSSRLRLPNGQPPFDVRLPCASGGPALPDTNDANNGVAVKVIEILGKAEFQSVRWISHRRPDSESFRPYEIAGMAHRESRYPSMIDINRVQGVQSK